MPIDPFTGALVGGVLQAGAGIYASNQAANAQQEAAKDAEAMQRRNMLMGIQANEPLRYAGYQALGDINSFLGYQTAPYASANQLATSLTPLTSKQVKQAIKGGAGFEQLAQMGTLGTGNKSIKRLIKAGLSMDQIQQLRTGMAPQAAQPQQAAQPASDPWNAIRNAPDYQFALSEGQRNIGNSFAARGGAASGNALRELARFGTGLADQGIDRMLQRRWDVVNGGQRAGENVQQTGSNYANYAGNAQMAQGDARASGIMGAANSVMGAVNNGFNNYYMGQYMNQMGRGVQAGSPSQYGPYAGGYQMPQQSRQWNYMDSLGSI